MHEIRINNFIFLRKDNPQISISDLVNVIPPPPPPSYTDIIKERTVNGVCLKGLHLGLGEVFGLQPRALIPTLICTMSLKY